MKLESLYGVEIEMSDESLALFNVDVEEGCVHVVGCEFRIIGGRDVKGSILIIDRPCAEEEGDAVCR